MPENYQSLENSSYEMEEIVGKVPPWIVRCGISVLFFISAIGISISCFIKFPDTLSANVIIQAVNQPGKIAIHRDDADQQFKFYVKEGQMVHVKDTLLTWTDMKTSEFHAIITPMAGKIYITNADDDKNILEQIMWVVPNSSKAKIKISYKDKGAGNVKVGQKVRISLFDFPESQFGFLDGNITSVLPIQPNGTHLAYVKLVRDKLITSTNNRIPILPMMHGVGGISINDRSIFQRIFGSIF